MYDNSNVNSDVQSLTFKDVHPIRYVWLAVEVSLANYMYKTKHNTWALIFGLFSLGTAGSIIEDIQRP